MKKDVNDRASERGGAGVKFLITASILVLAGHAAINYVPVAYEAESFKSEIGTAVLQGMALPGKVNPVENVKTRIQRAATANEIPADALIDVKQSGNAVTAHVAYTKPVSILPFGIYKYNYVFDHTATPSGFLLKQ